MLQCRCGSSFGGFGCSILLLLLLAGLRCSLQGDGETWGNTEGVGRFSTAGHNTHTYTPGLQYSTRASPTTHLAPTTLLLLLLLLLQPAARPP